MLVGDDPKYQSGAAPEATAAPADAIVSPDVFRENRVPPGQSRTRKWPVLQYGDVVDVPVSAWTLHVRGQVEEPYAINWAEFRALPRVKVFSDFHCVTRWSRLGNLWEGVALKTILDRARVRPSARFLVAVGYDGGWTTNMPLADALQDDVLLADTHDGEPLSADHGAPVRLVVPRLFAWKSAKWLRALVLLDHDEPGLWERAGYHNHGDPWVVNDTHPDGERFRDDPEYLAGQ